VVVDFGQNGAAVPHDFAGARRDFHSLNGKVKIVKLNVDENPGTAAKYGHHVDPDADAVQDGQLASRQVGAAPKQKLEQWITPRCDRAGFVATFNVVMAGLSRPFHFVVHGVRAVILMPKMPDSG